MKKMLLVLKRIFGPIYKLLLFVSKILGYVSTYVTFTIGFGLFALVGIIYRIIAKDPLDRKIEKGRKSYWGARPQEQFDREKYLRQF